MRAGEGCDDGPDNGQGGNQAVGGQPGTGSAPLVAAPGSRCRRTSGLVVRAFIGLLDEAAVDGRVEMADVRRVGAALMSAEGPLAAVYAQAEANCEKIFAAVATERHRGDRLGRLLVSTFSPLLDDPAAGLERKHLGQFFAAVRMIVGEQTYDELKARCFSIAEAHRTPDGLVDWKGFYRNPESRVVLERVLVTVARSFRRFDPRKDWFLILMNQSPTSTSLGSSAFVPKKRDDKSPGAFTEGHMCRLFKALFADMRPDSFDKLRRDAFIERWGVTPEDIFGPLFVELLRLDQRLTG